ncbi:ABC transporter substrate-binding protein [Xylanimonas sp. McL0601]|uniref:ABC transporter substrate-binding protein n=1 Tax=Xylanimonas sp. McL0601 TaxID=3414739 RepID=UPI003CF56A48
MRLARPVSGLAALAAVALAAGCGGGSAATPSSSGPTTPLTVVLDWTPNTNHSGLYLAQARGYFTQAGLDVTIVEPGETSGLQMVAAGRADVAYSVSEELLPARAQGADVVSIAAVIQHNTSSLISLTKDGIARPRDLAGKRYGSYGSDLENAIIRKLVTCDGGTPDAVKMTPLVSDDFRIGLTQDQFDAAWVFDAWDTIRLRDVDGMDVSTIPFADHTDCIPDWYTPILATSRSELSSKGDALKAFMDAVSHGYQDAIAEPSAAADALLKAAPELDPKLVKASAEWLATRYTDNPAHWGQQDAAVWNGFAGFLGDNGLLKGDPQVKDAWTNALLPGAR